MKYIVQFSDSYFYGSNHTVEISHPPSTAIECSNLIVQLVIAKIDTYIKNLGFTQLTKEWRTRKWHIHDFSDEWINNPPRIIYICSH